MKKYTFILCVLLLPAVLMPRSVHAAALCDSVFIDVPIEEVKVEATR